MNYHGDHPGGFPAVNRSMWSIKNQFLGIGLLRSVCVCVFFLWNSMHIFCYFRNEMLMGDLAGWFSITPEEMAPLGWTSADIVFPHLPGEGY